MQKLPILSGKKLLKVLAKFGFEAVRQKGSHVRIKKKTLEKAIVSVVPLHEKIDPSTLLGILKQCEISKEKFLEKMGKK